MHVVRFDDPDDLAKAAAGRFALEAGKAIQERERFLVALSGGSTPKRMFGLLREMDLDWSRIHVFWSDERFVPSDDPESNEGMARRELLSHVPIPSANIHGMFGEGSPEQCSVRYEAILREQGGTLDLTFLGMGPDGHTASLFPGEALLSERTRLVIPSNSSLGTRQRITFSIPMIARSRCVLLLIAGEDKRDAWQRVERGEPLPAKLLLDAAPATNVYLSI